MTCGEFRGQVSSRTGAAHSDANIAALGGHLRKCQPCGAWLAVANKPLAEQLRPFMRRGQGHLVPSGILERARRWMAAKFAKPPR